MRTVRHNFTSVSMTFSKTGTCPVCGCTAARIKAFSQTLNPFNKNAQGEIKTVKEIREELSVLGAKWKTEPVCHAKCED